MKSAQLFTSLLVVAALVLAVPTMASAAMLQSLTDLLGSSSPSTTTDHTFTFKASSSGTVMGIQFEFCRAPSGSCVAPGTGGSIFNTPSISTLSGLGAAGNWTPTPSGSALTITHATGVAYTAGNQYQVGINGVTNPAISTSGCQANGTNSSSVSCYVKITTASTTSLDSVLDTGVVSYSIVENVTVSARVDPTFTFTVQGVADHITNNGIETKVTSTYNTLPFGNLTVGTPVYAAHALFVRSNAQGGYSVSMKMSQQMTGVYTANNVDPFTAASATWGVPKAWASPTGTTANTNTAWIGANTTDSHGNNVFGPVDSNSVVVMHGAGSNAGTVPAYVTYALEANIYQPADTYTGTLVYNALPTY